MSGGVLAVLDDMRAKFIYANTRRGGDPAALEASCQTYDDARAAVAELIEADKEYDKAQQRAIGILEPTDHPVLVALRDAADRRDAALAKVQP